MSERAMPWLRYSLISRATPYELTYDYGFISITPNFFNMIVLIGALPHYGIYLSLISYLMRINEGTEVCWTSIYNPAHPSAYSFVLDLYSVRYRPAYPRLPEYHTESNVDTQYSL
jgi:hypothetical protein